MNWRSKALLQRVFSCVPKGAQLNYLCSRYLTKTLPQPESVTRLDYSFAANYLRYFRQAGEVPIEEAQFYEFGVGWNLTIPLSLYCLGVNRQLTTDIRRLLRPDLIAHSCRTLATMPLDPAPVRRPGRFCPAGNRTDFVSLLRNSFGIQYRAPFDARMTALADKSVDYITATKVLVFIPLKTLQGILKECARILRPQGSMAVLLDYRDNYSYFDANIGVYNFLQYSDQTWENIYNSSLFYQNRLRHSDYQRLFDEAGFEVVVGEAGYDGPIEAARKKLEKIPLAARFKNYEIDDLAAARATYVLRRKA